MHPQERLWQPNGFEPAFAETTEICKGRLPTSTAHATTAEINRVRVSSICRSRETIVDLNSYQRQEGLLYGSLSTFSCYRSARRRTSAPREFLKPGIEPLCVAMHGCR